MPSFRPKSPFKKRGAGVKNGLEIISATSPTESKKPTRNQRNVRSNGLKITSKGAGQPVDTRDPIKLSRDRSNTPREGSDHYSRQRESLELPDAEAIKSMSKAEAYALASKLSSHPALLSRQQSPSKPIQRSRDGSNTSREESVAAGQSDGSLELPDAEAIKSMSKAEAYALASKLARHPGVLSPSSNRQSIGSPPAGDAKKQEALRQAHEIAARRKKQRIVTPDMLASRPIERNSVMMRSRNAIKDDGSACDSATTEDTEVVANKKRANARRRRRLRSSGVGLMNESVASQRQPAGVELGVGEGLLRDDAYIPTLETLQSNGTWESAKEDDSSVYDERRLSSLSVPAKIEEKNSQPVIGAIEEEIKPIVSKTTPKIESNDGETQLRSAKEEDEVALAKCGDIDKRVDAKSVDKSSDKMQPQTAKKDEGTPSLSDGNAVRDNYVASHESSAKKQKPDDNASTGGGGDSKRRFSSLFKKKRDTSETMNAQPAETPPKLKSAADNSNKKPQTKAAITQPQAVTKEGGTDSVSEGAVGDEKPTASLESAKQEKTDDDASTSGSKRRFSSLFKKGRDKPETINAQPAENPTKHKSAADKSNEKPNPKATKKEGATASLSDGAVGDKSVASPGSAKQLKYDDDAITGGDTKASNKSGSRTSPPAADEASNANSAKAAESSEPTAEEESRREPRTKATPASSEVKIPNESDIEKGEPRSIWSVASAVSSMISPNGGSKNAKKTASDGVESESAASVNCGEGIPGASEYARSPSTVSKESLKTEVEYVLDGASPTPNEDVEHRRATKKSQSVAPLLSINTSALVGMVSNATPMSALSPTNKEDMEVQLQQKEDETSTEINRSMSISEELSKRLEETTSQINQLKDELLALARTGGGTHTSPASDSKGVETGGLEEGNELAEVEMKRKTSFRRLLPGKRGGKIDEGSSSMSKARPPKIMNRIDVIGKNSKPRGSADKESKREGTSIVKVPMKPPVTRQTPRYREEESTCGESMAMKSTLSNAEFLSVQSSITTDQEAFKCKPSRNITNGALNGPNIIKRTGSLVKNPALAWHVKQGKHAARIDSRKTESWSQKVNKNYFRSYRHPQVDQDNESTSAKDEIDGTPCQGEEDSSAFEPRDGDVKETNPAVDTRGISVASMGESMYVDNLTSKATHQPPIQKVAVPDQRMQRVQFRGVDGSSQPSDRATGNDSVLVEEDGDEFVEREAPPVSFVQTLAREKRARAKVSNPPTETQLRRIASNNIATQAQMEAPRASSELPRVPSHVVSQQYAAKESSGSGSLANVFESLALCSANLCMGSGRAMVACADTCSDSPGGCSRKYEAIDETNYAASKHNNLYNTQRIGSQQAGGIFRTPNASIDEAEKVAEGIYTKALTLAIQQQLSGQLTAEEQSTKSRELPRRGVWRDDTGSIESDFVPASNRRQKRVEDYESIDGRCVPVSQRKKDKYINVPMNIDVREKSREIHDSKQISQERPRDIEDAQRAQPGIMKNDQIIEQLNSRIANLEGKGIHGVQAPQAGGRSLKRTEPDHDRSKPPRGKDPPKRGGLRKLFKMPKIAVMYEV